MSLSSHGGGHGYLLLGEVGRTRSQRPRCCRRHQRPNVGSLARRSMQQPISVKRRSRNPRTSPSLPWGSRFQACTSRAIGKKTGYPHVAPFVSNRISSKPRKVKRILVDLYEQLNKTEQYTLNRKLHPSPNPSSPSYTKSATPKMPAQWPNPQAAPTFAAAQGVRSVLKETRVAM